MTNLLLHIFWYFKFLFNKSNFTKLKHQATSTFSRKLPFYNLLQHNNYSEKIASINLRIFTLKFMNDLPQQYLQKFNNNDTLFNLQVI